MTWWNKIVSCCGFILLNQRLEHEKEIKRVCCPCSCLTGVLPLAVFSRVQSFGPPADHSSSRPASQTSSGVIACQRRLRACFSSRRRAPDKKHIFTHKNEITGNWRAGALGGSACYRAVRVDELLSPVALYQLETKGGEENRDRREEKKKMELLRDSGSASWPAAIHVFLSAAHFFLFLSQFLPFPEQTTPPVL